MPDRKEMTFREWMEYFGYRWVEGQEQLYKGLMPQGSAETLIAQFEQGGIIKRA